RTDRARSFGSLVGTETHRAHARGAPYRHALLTSEWVTYEEQGVASAIEATTLARSTLRARRDLDAVGAMRSRDDLAREWVGVGPAGRADHRPFLTSAAGAETRKDGAEFVRALAHGQDTEPAFRNRGDPVSCAE